MDNRCSVLRTIQFFCWTAVHQRLIIFYFVIDRPCMRSHRVQNVKNWSGQNRTSRTACYGHAKDLLFPTLQLHKSNLLLHTYTEEHIKVLGGIIVSVQYGTQAKSLE